METPPCRADVNAAIADVLFVDPNELTSSTDLADLGLESIRLHSLIEHFRSAGADVTFAELAEDLHLAHWYRVLTDESS
ncbi:hypothetical protein CH298_21640 [Rhodococcoides fascians]|uniref:phosphopantetheine-binding protein n=1 Tax=Rhodococcoides fascians TaxID=1828 RepID=UPI00050CD2BC|nr:phosphopantetheine-binding protein [Rhodococcus fascians]OZD10409.1 hypothetical protein CH275_01690 [Rhodococcus sp. 06-235-1A]RZL72761.1 MAG: hypothetical protein EOP29_17410 [Rhodococcus sp. (in: high G+C Gram-positive bacteria)]MBY4208171.1 hypothetical protein [Rhodococcus fascians]OZE85302.1 hypothetical protein CH303_21995 [Rhodococcus fascians]OZF11809.1 hypothetical protein CH298_21640 [Rhodococcus fascians]